MRTRPAVLAIALIAQAAALAPPLGAHIAAAQAAPIALLHRRCKIACVWEDEEEYEEERGEILLPQDMDVDWVKNKLEALHEIPTEYDDTLSYEMYYEPEPQPVRQRLDEVASIIIIVLSVLLIMKQYLLHTGGGLIIVPEGDAIGIYNFNEVQHMESARLLKLGLPTPMSAAPPAGIFRWSNLLAFFDGSVPPP